MRIFEIILIGVGLAMDAFAVSLCKGLSSKLFSFKKCIIVGLYFGIFQGIMPLLGYMLGISFEELIVAIDHWIAFVLLVLIGINMMKESFSCCDDNLNDKVDFFEMVPLAIATSIDALTVGITFAFLQVDIFVAIIIISFLTLLICIVGFFIGNIFGNKFEKKAKFIGGMILIFMGIKILIEHLLF